jgi:hypothetical protein
MAVKRIPEYISSSKHVSYRVSLRFIGKHLDFQKIERVLGLKPTTVTRKGDFWRSNKVLGPAKMDVWIYGVRERTTEPLSKHLFKLMEKLTPHRLAVRRLAKEYNSEIYCSYLSDLAQGGFDIPPEVLKAIAECDLTLSISIFSWGGVIDDRNGKKSRSHHISKRRSILAQKE